MWRFAESKGARTVCMDYKVFIQTNEEQYLGAVVAA